jgi:hypothetical protein
MDGENKPAFAFMVSALPFMPFQNQKLIFKKPIRSIDLFRHMFPSLPGVEGALFGPARLNARGSPSEALSELAPGVQLL